MSYICHIIIYICHIIIYIYIGDLAAEEGVQRGRVKIGQGTEKLTGGTIIDRRKRYLLKGARARVAARVHVWSVGGRG